MQKVLNLYGGPGTGKSTVAAGVFYTLKMKYGINCEYVQEYAKDKAWEFSGVDKPPKVMLAQEYIFANQMFRMRRLIGEVDLIISDSPIVIGLAYMKDDFELPSLRNVVSEAYDMFDNQDVFLIRNKPYNPKGRFQTEDQAKALDSTVMKILNDRSKHFRQVVADGNCVENIIDSDFLGWLTND